MRPVREKDAIRLHADTRCAEHRYSANGMLALTRRSARGGQLPHLLVCLRAIHAGLIGQHCDFIDRHAESKCAGRDGRLLDAAQENGSIVELGYSSTVAFSTVGGGRQDRAIGIREG